MWEFDKYGNATNKETDDELYAILCTDGLSRVYHNGHVIAMFRKMKDAAEYIRHKVKELGGDV